MLNSESLQEHVLRRTEAERTAFRTEIAATGLDPLNGHIICPIPSCQMRLADLPAFHDYLIGHIASDPDHLRTWKNKVSSLVARNAYPWQEWATQYLDVVCPTCGEVASGWQTTHQLDLLKDLKEFHRCREQILQSCPGFGYNPIFDDVMPAVHRSSRRNP
jgi:hypothetical protein